jgi:HSP20 family molecular chaperone IbpA
MLQATPRHTLLEEVHHMSMMRYTPGFGPWFDRWLDTPARLFREWTQDVPSIDLEEGNGTLIARVEVPGVDPERLEVIVHDHALTVQGEISEEDHGGGFTGRRTGRFQRSITLPAPVRADAAEASCRHGVLKVTMPLREPERQGRRVPIRWQDEVQSH